MDWLGDLSTDRAILGAAWLIFVVLTLPFLLFAYRGQLLSAVKHLGVWLLLGLGLVTGYAYRDEVAVVVDRVSAEFAPAGTSVAVPAPEGERAVRIRRSFQGPFVARAKVNGVATLMLVDTGASSVVLRSADAEQAGINLKALRFDVAVETANGATYCAPVRLRQIGVGGIVYQNVDALVAKPGNLKESLLGMTFLKRLRSYDFSGDFLTLRS